MTSLRILKLSTRLDTDVFEGCTFKLESFTYSYPDNKYLRKFLSSQPSLKNVVFDAEPDFQSFEAMCLPNLTRFTGPFSWLPYIIPGRPINEVTVVEHISHKRSIDLSFFALVITQIQKLEIYYFYLYSMPGHLIASTFSSLTCLKMLTGAMFAISKNHGVCWTSLTIISLWNIEYLAIDWARNWSLDRRHSRCLSFTPNLYTPIFQLWISSCRDIYPVYYEIVRSGSSPWIFYG
jgi:hypothetical protein